MPPHVHESLQQMVAVLVERFEPERVILVGSHARGAATVDSDVDLLLVMPLPPGSRFATIVEMRRAVSHSPFPKDIFVCTPEEFAEYRDVVGTLMYPAAREGIVLYRRQPTRVREEPKGWDQDAPFSKIHEIDRLLELMPPAIDLGISSRDSAVLAPCAVDARYPSDSMPESVDLQAAIDAAAKVRSAARLRLPAGALA